MNIYQKQIELLEKQKNQEDIKKKYKIEDENIIVKETSNMPKFLIKTLFVIVQVFASILIVLLASVGAICIFYEPIREMFIKLAFSAISLM